MSVENAIIDEHRRRNRTTSERRMAMAPHRARVMQLIEEARGENGGSLCVLGAGNCNDIDLAQLAARFDRICLVDLDGDVLVRAADKLPGDLRARVDLRGETDLTGLIASLAPLRDVAVATDVEWKHAIRAASSAQAIDIGTFDVVASTCVLTQLIDCVYLGIGAEHPRAFELAMAVRNRHLELLAELLKPGGAGLLVTDFVSTETAPELSQLEDSALPQAAVNWLNQRNFFTGANPYAIREYYRNGVTSDLAVEGIQVTPAWRWDIGAKQFAVAAVTFRRNR